MNDAAERLRGLFRVSHTFEAFPVSVEEADGFLDAALVAERRATVERIRAALQEARITKASTAHDVSGVWYVVFQTIDAERDR